MSLNLHIRFYIFVFIVTSLMYFVACSSLRNKGSNQNETINAIDSKDTTLCSLPSYSYYIKLPGHLKGYFDYNEGLDCSRKKGRPLLVYFSKIGSIEAVNMEASVLVDSEITKIINENFILTALWNDDNLKIPLEFQEISLLSGDKLKTLGKKNEYYQLVKFKEDIQPAFYIINSNEEIMVKPYYYKLSKRSFKDFLLIGIESYKVSSTSTQN